MGAILKQVLTDWRTISTVVIGVLMAGTLLYLDKHHRISLMIRDWGVAGVVLAILLMVLWCLTPVPSEGLLIIFLRVYGVTLGTTYAWLGSTLSTLVIFYIARYFTRIWLSRVTSHERFEQINLWVKDRGSIGLLFARMLPVPAFVVNYAAGMIPAIGLWVYLWTAVISIIPYYLSVALIFEGVIGNWLYLIVGLIPLFLVGLIGLFIRKRGQKILDGQRNLFRWH